MDLDDLHKSFLAHAESDAAFQGELVKRLGKNEEALTDIKKILGDLVSTQGEIIEKQNEMAVTHNEIKDIFTFFKVGRNVGIGTAILITTFGTIIGAIYAIKSWIRS